MPIVRLGQSLCERVEVTKNRGFHSDPIAADGFGVDSFADTRADPSWRISSIKQSHDLARHFELPPSATGPSKFGAAQTDIAPSSGTGPFGVMLSTTRRRCWLSCDRKWWARYRTGGAR